MTIHTNRQVLELIPEPFTAELTHNGDYVRVRTAYQYPDGDIIDLFARPANTAANEVVITDLGETLGWLWVQHPDPDTRPEHRQMAADACARHGAELFRGAIRIIVPADDNLAAALHHAAQAARETAEAGRFEPAPPL